MYFGTPQGMTATGGSVSDYTVGAVYRTHIFTSTGTFDVTFITDSDFGTTIEYVVVAGGGGGGGDGEAGAGGAGGYRSSVSGESQVWRFFRISNNIISNNLTQ